MMRLFRKLIGQDCSSLHVPLRMCCIYEQPRKVLCLTSYMHSSNHFCSFVNSSSCVKTVGAPANSINPDLITILESVGQFGINEGELHTLMNNHPKLLSTPITFWENIVETLINFGFTKEDVLLILNRWPEVLSLKKTNLVKSLTAWNNCGFGERLVFQVLITHPSFLEVNEMLVSKRIKQYQIFFESKRRVGKLLLLAPNVLEESSDVLLDKLNYLNQLCTDNSDIVSSGVLAHSLFHIKARHEFLIRAGVYKKPDKTFSKRLDKNPRLESIVNTTDKEFTKKVAKLSSFEYDVFLEMFKEESQEEVYSDPEDSDDDVEMYKLSYKKR